MTKYTNKTFTIGVGGDAYAEGWERAFGKKAAPPAPPPSPPPAPLPEGVVLRTPENLASVQELERLVFRLGGAIRVESTHETGMVIVYIGQELQRLLTRIGMEIFDRDRLPFETTLTTLLSLQSKKFPSVEAAQAAVEAFFQNGLAPPGQGDLTMSSKKKTPSSVAVDVAVTPPVMGPRQPEPSPPARTARAPEGRVLSLEEKLAAELVEIRRAAQETLEVQRATVETLQAIETLLKSVVSTGMSHLNQAPAIRTVLR